MPQPKDIGKQLGRFAGIQRKEVPGTKGKLGGVTGSARLSGASMARAVTPPSFLNGNLLTKKTEKTGGVPNSTAGANVGWPIYLERLMILHD